MKQLIVFGAIGLGVLLLVLSGVWPSLFPGTSTWTEEKSVRWTQVKDRLHNLGFVVKNPNQRVSMHSGPETGTAKEEYDRLKKESEELKVEFQSAHDRPNTIAKVFKWTGISLAGLGIVGWYAIKNMND